MARPAKKEKDIIPDEKDVLISRMSATIEDLNAKINELTARISEKENEQKQKIIHRTEVFNREEPFQVREESQMKMLYEDKIRSMRNAIKILPPNLIVNGKHVAANIEAICGFKVDDSMISEAYEDFIHEA